MNKNSNPEYYEQEELWGGYQFITLEKVVNDYLSLRDDDDYTSRVGRDKIIIQAKRGIRELFASAMHQIRGQQLTLSDNLMIVLPQDYVNYVRVSWVDSDGILHPMASNKNLSMARRYLQDNVGGILLDNEGYEFEDDGGQQGNGLGYKKYEICCDDHYHGYNSHFRPNKDFSNDYPNGSFNIDTERGFIRFSSNVKSREIVLEYISDGLYIGTDAQDERNIKIHKFADSCLRSFIYYELIKQRRNIPMGEKALARKEYYNDLRLLKRKMNPIRLADFMQAFKSANKWVKK